MKLSLINIARSTIKAIAVSVAVFACYITITANPVYAQQTSNPVQQNQPQVTNNQQGQSSASSNTSLQSPTIADNVCRGVLSTQGSPITPDTTIDSCAESGDSSFAFLVKRIINIFSVVVGAVSVIMIIIGGFRYIISGGDSSGVSGAKNTILYAIVGLVIVLFAQVIVRFVLSTVSPT